LLNGKLFVTYAKQDAAKHDDVAGFGNGFIDIYNVDGSFNQRLVTGQPGNPASPLNSPWGMAIAPADFGDFSGDLLVGNFGNGKINAFDANTGAFLGTVDDASGRPIVIDGLWALTFGNGTAAGDTNTLFFSAGTDGEQHGLFGALVNAENTPLAGDGAKLTTTEGATITGTVAAFSSVDVGALPSAFSTTINWGDGSSSAGTIVPNGSGGFNVVGSHKFTEEGAFAVAVAINDAADDNFTMNASVSVSDAALSATGVSVNPAQGVTVNNATVATFTDAGGAEPAANYTANIDWGDGTTSAGVITAAGNGFNVSGTHTYTAAGVHTITTSIADEGGSAATATSSTATLVGEGETVTATEGAALNATIASFATNNSAATAGDFTANIDWGDGTTSAATVVVNAAGGFKVVGAHTYSEEATEAVHVTVSDGSQSLTIVGRADVSDAPLTASGASLTAGASGSNTTLTVATFTDAGGPEDVANYTASIDWGDGSAATSGVITVSGGTFSVSGSHTYSTAANHTVATTVHDEGGSQATATTQIVAGSEHERLIERIFADILGRVVDSAALSFFVGLLDSGVPASTIVAQIEASTEFLANEVQTLFEHFLHRSAEVGAVSFFSSLLAGGGTHNQTAEMIISSPEYFQVRGGGTSAGFMAALFQDALGRTIDADAQAFFNRLTLSDGNARGQVAAAVFASGEFLTDLVERDFETFLGRPADPAGLNAFLNALASGIDEDQLIALLAGSPEFASKL
jgi:PKD repeat protein